MKGILWVAMLIIGLTSCRAVFDDMPDAPYAGSSQTVPSGQYVEQDSMPQKPYSGSNMQQVVR